VVPRYATTSLQPTNQFSSCMHVMNLNWSATKRRLHVDKRAKVDKLLDYHDILAVACACE